MANAHPVLKGALAQSNKGAKIVSLVLMMQMMNSANAALATKARLRPKPVASGFSLVLPKCPTSSKPNALAIVPVVQVGAVVAGRAV